MDAKEGLSLLNPYAKRGGAIDLFDLRKPHMFDVKDSSQSVSIGIIVASQGRRYVARPLNIVSVNLTFKPYTEAETIDVWGNARPIHYCHGAELEERKFEVFRQATDEEEIGYAYPREVWAAVVARDVYIAIPRRPFGSIRSFGAFRKADSEAFNYLYGLAPIPKRKLGLRSLLKPFLR